MILQLIRVEFADPRIRAIDHIDDLCEAVEHAKWNLHTRHHIEIQPPRKVGDNVLIGISIPDMFPGIFRVGNHLRGVSKYLLRTYPERYSNFRIGTRLLYYIEIE